MDPRLSEASWEELAASILKRVAEGEHDDLVADLAARLIERFAWKPYFEQYFQFWEKHGFHLTPVHFYYPIPDTRTIGDDFWARSSEMAGVDMNDRVQLELLNDIFPRLRDEYDSFPTEPSHGDLAHRYYFNNPFFGGTDALVLYCMVRHFRPRRVLEVGSGFSSRISAEAALRNGETELVCIEPYPDEVLQQGFPGLTSLLRRKVQEVGSEPFEQLGAGDILFIDSSHVVSLGSDVNFLFLEVLPRLAPGVIVHVHDIYFPKMARRDWVMENFRFWNEQDLLQSFLAFNAEFEILFCNNYVEAKYPKQFRDAFPKSPWWGGGSFWMRRRVRGVPAAG
jgi:hypothetical protein